MSSQKTSAQCQWEAMLFGHFRDGAPEGLRAAIDSALVQIECDDCATEIGTNDLRPRATLADAVDSADTPPDVVIGITGNNMEKILAICSDIVKTLMARYPDFKCTALGCRRHEILTGFGPVKVFYGLRRLAHLDRAEFQDYWLNKHADVGRALIPPYSYIQSHADNEFTKALSARVGLPASDLDGVATVHFPDEPACDAQLARDDVAEIAIEDERKFIDHDQVIFAIMHTKGTQQ